MITLYRRGKVFWLESNFRGLRERWSLGTRDRQVADELKRAYELKILGRGKLAPKQWVDFQAEFLMNSKPHVCETTLDEYTRVLKRFAQFLVAEKIVDVCDVEASTVTRYMGSRAKDVHRVNRRPVSPGGIKYELRVLRCAFNYAIAAGYLEKNPVRAGNLNAVAGRTQPFSPEETAAMLCSGYLEGKAYLRAIVLLFLHTGLRISDVIYLRQAALSGKVLTVKTQKRNTVVRLELPPEVTAGLAALKKHPKSPYVFNTENGRPIVSLDKHLRRLWRACGIAGGHAHRFRDTFAVRLLEKGATLYDVAKLLGISHQTAEAHYTPYCRELQARGAAFLRQLDYGT